MIRFLLRELAGWVLILIGLGLFFLCILMLLDAKPQILEAPVVSVIGIVVFRGGIHLLKVGVAARICLQTQGELKKQQQAVKPPAKGEAPWDW